MKIIYATFTSRNAAEAALRDLEGHHSIREDSGHVHLGYIANRRLPAQARLPRVGALGGTLAGAAVGVAAALMATGIMAMFGGPPMPIMENQGELILVAALGGGGLGGLAGLLSGAASTKKPIADLNARVEQGEALLTAETADMNVDVARDIARRHGAALVGAM